MDFSRVSQDQQLLDFTADAADVISEGGEEEAAEEVRGAQAVWGICHQMVPGSLQKSGAQRHQSRCVLFCVL